jgi:hypothetical protein
MGHAGIVDDRLLGPDVHQIVRVFIPTKYHILRWIRLPGLQLNPTRQTLPGLSKCIGLAQTPASDFWMAP